MGGRGKEIQKLKMTFSRERVCHFSLELQAIRPSKSFGSRRKAILRGAGNAWAPVLGVFDKLREVGVSPYLGFTLCLSTFVDV